MTPEEAFLEAIIESPDDDAHRLVFADWLEDHEQPARAEFIRIQVELARLPEDASKPEEFQAREKVLLAEHGERWAGPLRGLCTEWTFRRGFVEEVVLAAAMFLDQASALFRLAPVHHARIVEVGDRLLDLARSPHLRHLDGLDLTLNEFGDEGAEALARSEFLSSLRVLVLGGCGIGPRWGRKRSLHRNPDVLPAGATACHWLRPRGSTNLRCP